jgi:hypothetical protein
MGRIIEDASRLHGGDTTGRLGIEQFGACPQFPTGDHGGAEDHAPGAEGPRHLRGIDLGGGIGEAVSPGQQGSGAHRPQWFEVVERQIQQIGGALAQPDGFGRGAGDPKREDRDQLRVQLDGAGGELAWWEGAVRALSQQPVTQGEGEERECRSAEVPPDHFPSLANAWRALVTRGCSSESASFQRSVKSR